MSGDIALYVHVPFCRRKCRYCSFISFEKRENVIPVYLEALKKELELRSCGETVHSVYFGGGTPSLLPAESLAGMLSTIGKLFTLDKNAEITIEANPGTVNETYLQAVRKAGINRFSLGVQSFNDNELAMLGRIHNSAEAGKAVKYARRAGFDNLNIDLIYGLPGQTKDDWRQNVEAALKLEPEHLSLYALTLDEDTPLQKIIDKGLLPAIDPDLSADMYESAEDVLESHGYTHYEISNWAKESKECRHNLIYWQNLPYLGIGVAAHSCLDGRRMANTNDLDKYLAEFSGQPSWKPEMAEEIPLKLELAETVILGLRLSQGIQKENIKKRFGVNIMEKFRWQIKEMTDAGLLKQDDGHISLTRRGRLLSNQVFYRFLPE